MSAYRSDIDGLRGVAIILVVGFHAFPSVIRGGFIGVDIFFVISGFLISAILFESLDKGTFSFTEFYARRIRRIFPALLVVLVVCYVVGWFVLLPNEYKQLGKHIVGGVAFVSNLLFWNEAGYFDNNSDTKPLLHLWSLGIEEQFYIVWPLLLWIAWKKNFSFFYLIVSLILVSFFLNVKNVHGDHIGNFFSPQTRFWELLSGSFLAWLELYGRTHASINKTQNSFFRRSLFLQSSEQKPDENHMSEFNASFQAGIIKLANKYEKELSNSKSLLGLIFITCSMRYITKDIDFPGGWALFPILGSMLIISAGKRAWLNNAILSNRLLVWFGLASFPLYLWHWPLISFVRVIEGVSPPISIRMATVVSSIILSWLTYN